jgi:hypothetical protein
MKKETIEDRLKKQYPYAASWINFLKNDNKDRYHGYNGEYNRSNFTSRNPFSIFISFINDPVIIGILLGVAIFIYPCTKKIRMGLCGYFKSYSIIDNKQDNRQKRCGIYQ